MVPVHCSKCQAPAHWKPKGGPSLRTLVCRQCGERALKKTVTPRTRRVALEAAAESRAHAAPPAPRPDTLKARKVHALERIAAALEALREMGNEAGYARGITKPRAPRPISLDSERERVKFLPRRGDSLDFGGGRKLVAWAVGSAAVLVQAHSDGAVIEEARTLEQWRAAVDVAERILPAGGAA